MHQSELWEAKARACLLYSGCLLVPISLWRINPHSKLWDLIIGAPSHSEPVWGGDSFDLFPKALHAQPATKSQLCALGERISWLPDSSRELQCHFPDKVQYKATDQAITVTKVNGEKPQWPWVQTAWHMQVPTLGTGAPLGHWDTWGERGWQRALKSPGGVNVWWKQVWTGSRILSNTCKSNIHKVGDCEDQHFQTHCPLDKKCSKGHSLSCIWKVMESFPWILPAAVFWWRK